MLIWVVFVKYDIFNFSKSTWFVLVLIEACLWTESKIFVDFEIRIRVTMRMLVGGGYKCTVVVEEWICLIVSAVVVAVR